MRLSGRQWLAGLLGGLGLLTTTAAMAQAPGGAVAFVYHRFGEGAYPSTNTTLEQLEQHITTLQDGGYQVLPLPQIVDALRRREPLPDKAVALTMDDAFVSIYREAWPRLRQAGLPFTVFVATEPVDAGVDGYMSWEQVRTLAAAGVTIGHHTVSHAHLPTLADAALPAELADATRRFRAELGVEPTLFAYPYGEYGLREQKLVREAGFAAAFGQHSGAMHADEDLFGLPRFALNERFGTLDRFRLAAGALPLPLGDLTPLERVLRADNNPPAVGFTIDAKVNGLDNLRCYASNLSEPARLERLGPRRVEVRLDKPFPQGRGRLNCTVPGPQGRWRWFGMQFTVP
ncbi:MAG: polysaccharide deacetylase family protein [Alphaproteobacteria bacterium]